MREFMPGKPGWVERGGTKPSESASGPVRVTAGPREGALLSPYTEAEVEEIVRRGREEPRRLNLAEARLAERNREADVTVGRANEQWAKAGFSAFTAPTDHVALCPPFATEADANYDAVHGAGAARAYRGKN